jgi:hypothetical protein
MRFNRAAHPLAVRSKRNLNCYRFISLLRKELPRMKKINFIIKTLNILGFFCTLATLILAILWFLQQKNYYEPITVALGSMSAILIIIAQVLQKKFPVNELEKEKCTGLTSGEILEIIKNSNPSEWDVNYSQDGEIAIFKEYPLLRIETKHNKDFVHNEDFREKWANMFLDPHATSYRYQIYLGETRLRELILVSVDGGRALLPLPKSAIDLRVEPLRYKIAIIFDQFDTCDEYMKKAGLYLVQ